VPNPYYVFSGNILPGQLARAETLQSEFNNIAAGFALLVIQGVDSGTATAYVVTTQGQPTGAYVDGTTIQFKPNSTNTGAATLAVNGLPATSIVRFNNTALIAGDVVGGAWVEVVYDAAISAFRFTSAGQTAVVSGTISPAPPVNKVGLVAAGGSAITVLPSDATWAIDQSISPTWTGAHTFSNTITVNGGMTSSAGIVVNSATGGAQGIGTINALGLFVNGVAVVTTATVAGGANPTASVGLAAVNGSATSFMRSDGAPALSQSIAPTWTGAHTFTPASGVGITANASTGNFGLIVNGTGLVDSMAINSAGRFSSVVLQHATVLRGQFAWDETASKATLSTNVAGGIVQILSGNGAAGIVIGASQNVTISAPVSGDALTINTASGGNAITMQNAGAVAVEIQMTNSAGTMSIDITNLGTSQIVATGALQLSVPSSKGITIASAGAVSIAAPTSGVALTVNSVAATTGLVINLADSVSNGIQIVDGGANLTQLRLLTNNTTARIQATGTTTAITLEVPGGGVAVTVASTGGVTIANPTGGSKGVGTINALNGYYTNGVNNIQTGTFTGTLTGCTTSPTATFNYTIINGSIATVSCATTLLATSNATTCTITGLPAVLQPTRQQACGAQVEDNTLLVSGFVVFLAASGTINLAVAGNTFTPTGTKGLPEAGQCFTYNLN
jgi:hypothetical protein